MGLTLTLAEAKALGIGALHPAARRWAPRSGADGMTKLERSFRDLVLIPAVARRDLVAYWREPIKLRLAGRTWYTPDFLAVAPAADPAGVMPTFVEVKGFMREDANVKLKVAAADYPCFRFLLVYRRAQAWTVHEVTPAGGVAATPGVVPWIHGLAGIDNL